MYRYLAKTYMSLRECLVPSQRLEAQTEILADLHGCIENLNTRVLELEARIDRCKQQAVYHVQLGKREATTTGRAREMQRARLCMEERRRVQSEHDKALRMTHMLQMQIDSIVSSNVDNLIVDTMRAYNMNAARLAMPKRASQIAKLGDELTERQSELMTLQDAMAGVTMLPMEGGPDAASLDEQELMQELDSLMQTPAEEDEYAEQEAPETKRQNQNATTDPPHRNPSESSLIASTVDPSHNTSSNRLSRVDDEKKSAAEDELEPLLLAAPAASS
jgi:hypothetical protein